MVLGRWGLVSLPLLISLSAGISRGQPGTITTWAGSTSDTAQARFIGLTVPRHLTIDPSGNLLIAASRSVISVSPRGFARPLVSEVGVWCWSLRVLPPDLPYAFLFSANPIVTPNGTLIAANGACGGLWRWDPSGSIHRIDDLTGVEDTRFTSLALAADGSIYAVLQSANRVYRFWQDGRVETVAGTGPAEFAGDGGPANRARLSRPTAVAVGADGTVYIADAFNYRIRAISPDGIIRTVAGNGRIGFSGDGAAATGASIGFVTALTVDRLGRLLFVDQSNARVRAIDAGVLRTVLGNGRRVNAGDQGPATAASIASAAGIAVGPDGSVFVSDSESQIVRRVSPDGIVTTYAGLPPEFGDREAPTFARLIQPIGVAFDKEGGAYIAEWPTGRLRRVQPDGRITTIVSNYSFNYSGSVCLVAAPEGGVYTCTGGAVEHIDLAGRRRVIAGDPQRSGSSGDGGPASAARLLYPTGLLLAADGTLFISDTWQNVIRRIDPNGIIQTHAGNGSEGFSGDGGPARLARLASPRGMALDAQGSLYFADASNGRIRKVDRGGIISTVAGNGGSTGEVFSDGSPALSTALINPDTLAFDARGDLYIDEYRPWLLKMVNGRIYRVAGDPAFLGTFGDGGDARQARLMPAGIAVDANGNVYVADITADRIRRIQGASPFSVTPAALSFSTVLNLAPPPRAIRIASATSGRRNFSVRADVPWLDVSVTGGTVTDDGGVNVIVAAAPPRQSGYFQARITVTDTGTQEVTSIPVTLSVSTTPQQMRLGQTALTFEVADGARLPEGFARTLAVVNNGVGEMRWSAEASTLSGGNWLRILDAEGVSAAGAPAEIRVAVDPGGLAEGIYYGLITVTSPQADNSPQSAVVILAVLPASTGATASVSPRGLLFAASGVGGNTPAQSVEIANLGNRAISFNASVRYPPGQQAWARLGSTGGSVPVGGVIALPVEVLPGIAAGVYQGEVVLNLLPDGGSVTVQMFLAVSGERAPGAAAKNARAADADACLPQRILAVFRAPGSGLNLPAGWPLSVDVAAMDDCGIPVNSGRATAQANTGDPPLALGAIGGGRWTGTLAGRNAQSGRLELRVQVNSGTLSGSATLEGSVGQASARPSIDEGGVVNLAQPDRDAPIGVGSLLAVKGANLSIADWIAAESAAWQPQLGETKVLLGGRPIPLGQVTRTRAQAIVPGETPPNTRHQLVVQRGSTYSTPADIVIVGAAPVILSADGSGSGQGEIFRELRGEGRVLANSARPARPGEQIVILATGLGPTDPALPPGTPGPNDPIAMVSRPVRVTIDGVEAIVESAMAEPGRVGVFRVTATVPTTVNSAASAAVVLSVDGLRSPAVTMAVSTASAVDR